MIEALPKRPGVQMAKAICDDCGKDEVVSCGYDRDGQPNEGQVVKKLNAQGWAFVKGKMRCMSCEAKRKVVPMKPVSKVEKEQPIREATKAERREIMLMLAEVYDTSQERYRNGDTDDTVADVLSVMPGWVAEMREDFFGPDGGNEDIEALKSEVASAIGANERDTKALQQVLNKAKGSGDQLKEILDKLEKIKKAIGPRNMQKTNIS